VQLARQQCYNAARDAIALHHILKDTPEQENLEDWVVEKLTQAASNLKDVIEHLEELRSGGDGEEMDIMSAFSFESAEAKYAELLSESEQIDELLKMSPEQADIGERINTLNKAYISARNLNDLVTMRKIKAQLSQLAARKASMTPIGEEQVNELYADRAAENEWHQQERPRGQVVAAQAPRSFFIVDRATGKKLKAFNVRSEAERAAARMGGFSKVKVIGEEEVENDADPITELDASTMQNYLKKRKETPTPRSVHKAVNQANGVRSAHEKIHDQLVKKTAIQGGDTRVREDADVGAIQALTDEALQHYLNDFKSQYRMGDQSAKKTILVLNQEVKRRNSAGSVEGLPEGKFTVNAKTGAKLDPRTGAELPAKEKPVTMKQMFATPKAPAQPKLTLNDVWRQVEHVVGQIFPDGDPIDWMAPWLQKRGYKDFQIGEIIDRAARKNGYKDMYAYYDELKQQHADDQAYDAQMGESEQVDEISRKAVGAYRKAATADLEKTQAKHDADSKDGWHYQDSYDEHNAWERMHKRKQGLKRANGEKTNEEQVDELSVGTLKSYVPKANRSREKATDDMMHDGGYDAKVDDKMGRRAEFTMKANNKINKQPEEVTELSKNTLGSYAKKANAARSHEPDDMKADRRGTGVMKSLDKIAGGPNKGGALKGKAAQAHFAAKHGNSHNTPNKDRADFEKAVDKKTVKEDATAGGTSVGGIAAGIAGAKVGKPGTGKPKDLGNKVSRKQVQVGKGVY
jgi:hypothetical protein